VLRLTGTITDQSQGVIPNATITVTAQATGLQYSAVTNGVGAFTISSLPVGDYTGSITGNGFEPLHVETFTLNVGQTRTFNAMMQVGSVTSQVKVVTAIPDLDQVTAEVGGVIQAPQTESLPVNGRYWASLMALIPGAISSGTGTQDTIRFTGLNNFRFDGVDATGLNHQFVKVAVRIQFPLESIAEFKASSAVYSADVGGMAGGQISMVSQGGTNDYHGSLYEYFRNSYFDAKAFDRRRLRLSG
jgi:hypothetical protein